VSKEAVRRANVSANSRIIAPSTSSNLVARIAIRKLLAISDAVQRSQAVRSRGLAILCVFAPNAVVSERKARIAVSSSVANRASKRVIARTCCSIDALMQRRAPSASGSQNALIANGGSAVAISGARENLRSRALS